jgi:hypothetical protein
MLLACELNQLKIVLKNKISEKVKKRIIEKIIPGEFYFSHKGYCPCCDKEVIFQAYNNWLRDNFICPKCFSIPRERALMLIIEKYFPGWRDLDIHESSPYNRGASEKLKNECKKYISSQYYPDQPFGAIINGDRNEDLEYQTFPDSVFDIFVTQDVMEHVYNPARAFSEIGRTLKDGGAHIFTVPMVNKHAKTEVWAVKGEDGNPIFTQKAEYHGNPVDPKGSPVTMHWGFDIVDFINSKSKLKTTIEHIDDLHYGIRAEYIEVLVSQK